MNRLKMLVVAASCLSVAVPALITTADAAVVVRKTVVVKRGYGPRYYAPRRFYGARHVCRTTVVTTAGRRVVRKVCR